MKTIIECMPTDVLRDLLTGEYFIDANTKLTKDMTTPGSIFGQIYAELEKRDEADRD